MNAAHLHLLLNHLPIIGFAIGLLLLGVATVFRGDRGIFLASVIVLVISGGGGLATQFTGEPAEEVVEHLPGVSESLIESHEKAGGVATIISSITMLIAVVLGIVALRREGRIAVIPLSILIVATAVTCGAMAWAGWTGGKVRHTEVRVTNSANPAPQERDVD